MSTELRTLVAEMLSSKLAYAHKLGALRNAGVKMDGAAGPQSLQALIDHELDSARALEQILMRLR